MESRVWNPESGTLTLIVFVSVKIVIKNVEVHMNVREVLYEWICDERMLGVIRE